MKLEHNGKHCPCCMHSPAHDPDSELALAIESLQALETLLAQAEDLPPGWIGLLIEPIRVRIEHARQTLNQEHPA